MGWIFALVARPGIGGDGTQIEMAFLGGRINEVGHGLEWVSWLRVDGREGTGERGGGRASSGRDERIQGGEVYDQENETVFASVVG